MLIQPNFSIPSNDDKKLYMALDGSGSMFDNSQINWNLQTEKMILCYEENKRSPIQGFVWSSGDVITCPLFVKRILMEQHLGTYKNGNLTVPSTFFVTFLSYLQKNNVSNDENIHIIFSTDGEICVRDDVKTEN